MTSGRGWSLAILVDLGRRQGLDRASNLQHAVNRQSTVPSIGSLRSTLCQERRVACNTRRPDRDLGRWTIAQPRRVQSVKNIVRNLAVIVVSLVVSVARAERHDTKFKSVPDSSLQIRAVEYDGSVNGTLKVQVKNTQKTAQEFTATGLYFVVGVSCRASAQLFQSFRGRGLSPPATNRLLGAALSYSRRIASTGSSRDARYAG